MTPKQTLKKVLLELGRPASEQVVPRASIQQVLRENDPHSLPEFPKVATTEATHTHYFRGLLALANIAVDEDDWSLARWLPAMIGMDGQAWLCTELPEVDFWVKPALYLSVLERMLQIEATWNWKLQILQDTSRPWQNLCPAACVIRHWQRIDRDVNERYIESAASILRFLVEQVCPLLDSRASYVDQWFGIPTMPLGFFTYDSAQAFVNAVCTYKHPDVRSEAHPSDSNIILLPRHELHVGSNTVTLRRRRGLGPVYVGTWSIAGKPDVTGTYEWDGLRIHRRATNFPEFASIEGEFWIEYFRRRKGEGFDPYALV